MNLELIKSMNFEHALATLEQQLSSEMLELLRVMTNKACDERDALLDDYERERKETKELHEKRVGELEAVILKVAAIAKLEKE